MTKLSAYMDIVFCLVVLPVMLSMFPVEGWFMRMSWYVVALVVWLYGVYFLNRLVTVPSLFKGRPYYYLGIAIIVLSLVVTYYMSTIELFPPKPPRHHEFHDMVRILPVARPYQQAVWSLFMIVIAFSFAVGLFTQTEIHRSRNREIEAQRNRAEIDLYKAQIKPHFMFNTLNSLYGLFLTNNPNALPSLEKFISMTRYIHTSSHCQMVPLADEADYIRQYVDIQSLRLSELTKVDLNIDIEASTGRLNVPPMLLITFVENCFKHGVSSREEGHIHISLTAREGRLKLHTVNNIFPIERVGEHRGIDNCRRRLDLSYPDAYSLDITRHDNQFEVNLTINLDKKHKND